MPLKADEMGAQRCVNDDDLYPRAEQMWEGCEESIGFVVRWRIRQGVIRRVSACGPMALGQPGPAAHSREGGKPFGLAIYECAMDSHLGGNDKMEAT